MTIKLSSLFLVLIFCVAVSAQGIKFQSTQLKPVAGQRSLIIDGFFFETAKGRVEIRTYNAAVGKQAWKQEMSAVDGHKITLSVRPNAGNFDVSFSAQPATDITKWGLAIAATTDEYYTGLMERVVDGPQAKSWATGIQEALNLRGQKIDMIIKPTTSVYAPYYLSSRGYALMVKGNWPGYFDFAVSDPNRVKIEFEGPTFEMKIYTASDPATLVRAHAIDAGPPFMPPKWMFHPWRWRDEHN